MQFETRVMYLQHYQRLPVRNALQTGCVSGQPMHNCLDMARQKSVDAGVKSQKKSGSVVSGLSGDRKAAPAGLGRIDDPQEVLHRISVLTSKLESTLDLVRANGNVRDFTTLVRELRGVYELCARLSGLLSDRITVQIIKSPIFLAFTERVGQAVLDCPRCAAQYEQALRDAIEAGKGEHATAAE